MVWRYAAALHLLGKDLGALVDRVLERQEERFDRFYPDAFGCGP